MNTVGAVLILLLVISHQLASSLLSKEPPTTELGTDTANAVFTTKVDWYKPPPRGFDRSHEVELPSQLFSAVPTSRIEEATVLLSKADVIPLTLEQVAKFSGIDPKGVLQIEIQKAEEKLRFYQEEQKRPVNTDLIKEYGKHEVHEWKRRRLRYMSELKRDIAQFEQWEDQLKPYLIKGVALEAGGHFSGTLISEDIVIAFGAMGSHGVPMERRPVVAFLPKKPRRVYTTVWMAQ